MITPSTNSVVTARFAGAMYNLALNYSTTQQVLASTSTPGAMTDVENQLFIRDFSNMATGDVATIVATNLGLTGEAFDAAVVFLTGWITGTVFTERGAVIAQIVNNFSLMTEDPTFGTFAKAWNTKVGNAVAYAQNSSSTATIAFPDVPSANLDSFTLTNGTDIATANIFTAGLVYTPGGNDRINSLQDEDQLTGTGTAPTLNATLGNANDNGGPIITPKLTGIEVVNAAFTGSNPIAVQALDLQDATGLKTVNITRISQSSDIARIENVKQVLESMRIASSNANDDAAGVAEFSFGTGVLANNNAATLTLDNVQIRRVNIGQNVNATTAAVAGQGYEDLTINSTGSPNSVGILGLPMDSGTAGKVTIKGDQSLALAFRTNVTSGGNNASNVEVQLFDGGITQAQGRLSEVNASELAGSLRLSIGGPSGSRILSTVKADTSGVPQDVKIIGTANNDTFYLSDVVQKGDLIDGGDGADTLVVYTDGNIGTIKSVEKIDVQVNGNAGSNDVNLDFNNLKDATIEQVRNITNGFVTAGVSGDNGANQHVNLYNLTIDQAKAEIVSHSTSGNNGINDTTLNATFVVSAPGTPANDTQTVKIIDGNNVDPRFNLTLMNLPLNSVSQQDIPNLTIVDADSESNSILLTNVVKHTKTITVGTTDGSGAAGTFISFDTGQRAATGVNAVGQPVGSFDQRGGYRLDADGTANDFSVDYSIPNTIFYGAIAAANVDTVFNSLPLTANIRYNTLDNGIDTLVGPGGIVLPLPDLVHIIAENFDASAETSDVIARFGDVTRADGVSSQAVKGGAGNDTFIFDARGPKNSGYTSGDTVAGGAGLDTLVIDGFTAPGVGAVSVQKSEWDNTTGIDALRLAGNQGTTNGTGVITGTGILRSNVNAGGYYIEIDNEFVKQSDAQNNLKIISNDGNLGTNLESDLLLNLRTLVQNSNVTFVGPNSNSTAAGTNALVRVQLEDNSANGANSLDGGDSLVNSTLQNSEELTIVSGVTYYTSSGNNNVLEVFNNADVSINDLSKTKNFGRIEGTNDVAIAQTLKLVLNDTVMDQLVDSGTAARIATATSTATIPANIEHLTVVANNNNNVVGAVQNLNISATNVTNKFDLEVLVGRGTTNTLILTGGQDAVVMLGNYTAAQAAGYQEGYVTSTGENVSKFVGANTISNAYLVENANGVDFTGADGLAGNADDVLLAYGGRLGSNNGIGAPNDILEVFGGVDLTAIPAGDLTNFTIVAHSSLRLTSEQMASVGGIQFVGAGVAHGLGVTNNADGTGSTLTNALNKVTVANSAGNLTYYTGTAVTTLSGTATLVDGGTAPVNGGVLGSGGGGGGGGGGALTPFVVDGLGSLTAQASQTLATGAFNLTDNVNVLENVRISNFGADDQITITGATSANYDSAISADAAGNVTITYNTGAGVLNQIVLVGVNPGGAFVNDVASFNALAVGNLVFA